MTYLKYLIMLVLLACCGKTNAQIDMPKWNDDYSRTVAKLEAGQTDIDFRDFRFSFLKSKQFGVKGQKFNEFDSLKKQLFKEVEDRNHSGVVEVARKLLAIDYTYLYAQKYLYQAYKQIGDSVNMKKYKEIELSLLSSIIRHNNGKSCESTWEAAQVYEEYFILNVLGAKLEKQTLTSCDKLVVDALDVNKNEEKVRYYFDVTEMMVQEEKMLNGK